MRVNVWNNSKDIYKSKNLFFERTKPNLDFGRVKTEGEGWTKMNRIRSKKTSKKLK